MSNEEIKPIELGYLDAKATAIWVVRDGAVWCLDRTKTIKTYAPMDRVGGPYGIFDFVDDSDGDKWFLACVADCAFPCHDLVRGNSWEEAYETYCDWAASRRHIEITKEELKDYDEDNLHYTSNGVPIDTEAIHMDEVKLMRIDFGAFVIDHVNDNKFHCAQCSQVVEPGTKCEWGRTH